MKKLTYQDLLNMENEWVIVEDNINDYHNQECVVLFKEVSCNECGNLYTRISLDNENYCFDYDKDGNCVDGDFDVYMVE